MKRLIGIGIGLIVVMSLAGCSNSNNGGSPPPSHSGITIIGAHSESELCWNCSRKYSVSFRDDDPSHYGQHRYQLLLRRGSDSVFGQWIDWRNSGGDTTGSVTAANFNSFQGDYELIVRRYADNGLPFSEEATYQSTISVPQFGAGCYDDCCTQTVNRQYAGAYQELSSGYARGLSFDLETSWGSLCAQSSSQEACFSCTWGGLSALVEDTVRHWTQVGFHNGHKTVKDSIVHLDTAVYVEIHPNLAQGYSKVQTIWWPADSIWDWLGVDITQENESLTFEFYYTGTGDFEFWMNNSERFLGLGNSYVNPANFRVVQFLGEIIHYENDMAGCETDSCWFRNCMYKSSGGSWVPTALDTLDTPATKASQWGAAVFDGEYVGDSVAIWDKNRLPFKK